MIVIKFPQVFVTFPKNCPKKALKTLKFQTYTAIFCLLQLNCAKNTHLTHVLHNVQFNSNQIVKLLIFPNREIFSKLVILNYTPSEQVHANRRHPWSDIEHSELK